MIHCKIIANNLVNINQLLANVSKKLIYYFPSTTLAVLHEKQDFIYIGIQLSNIRVDVRNDILVTRETTLHKAIFEKVLN